MDNAMQNLCHNNVAWQTERVKSKQRHPNVFSCKQNGTYLDYREPELDIYTCLLTKNWKTLYQWVVIQRNFEQSQLLTSHENTEEQKWLPCVYILLICLI
jgi:hypothetical protein